MSLRQHGGAALAGWDGPYHPALAPNLAAAFEGRQDGERNRASLEDAVRELPGFQRIFRPPAAADGYQWFWCIEFAVHAGKVVVALPWVTDNSRADNSSLDRSPAAYTQGIHVNIETANAIFLRVIRAIRPGGRRRPILTGP